MKTTKLGFYVLMLTIIFASCGKDDEMPTITFQGAEENHQFFNGDIFSATVIVEDNEELDSVYTTLKAGLYVTTTSQQVTAVSKTIVIDETLSFDYEGIMEYKVEAVDKNGNRSTFTREFLYDGSEKGDLNINFKLKYNDAPLVMFENYEFPDGRSMKFTRFSFYISDIKLDSELIEEISYQNLTNHNSEAPQAAAGYEWQIYNIEPGTYSNLSFGIGVPETENAMDPDDFPAGHALNSPSENWFSWKSYIFLKVEGFIDMDDNGDQETGVALHIGSDPAYRYFTMPKNVEIIKGEVTDLELEMDLYDFLGGSDATYNIDSDPQIHSLTQIDQVTELADNIDIK